MTFDQKFLEIVKKEGVPPPPNAVANYLPYRLVSNMLYLSGQAPFRGHDIPYKGKLGAGVSVADGTAAARLTGLNLLYEARAALGTLDDVETIVSIDGMVNCTPEFTDQSAVIDGCSDLLVEVFGDAGKHTRSAVGQTALAMDITTEIKMQMLVSSDGRKKAI